MKIPLYLATFTMASVGIAVMIEPHNKIKANEKIHLMILLQ